ncbi:MAG: AAC(3) family N-acetyltransferase [Spirochaetia bacterium]|nr:AAC(3) family N-acetyltransferase [Spirochaetia bacterium]
MIEKLVNEWEKAGIQQGDVILLHSSLKRTLTRYSINGIKLTPEDILESFLVAIGPLGTILLPLFNFDYTKGIPFDIRHTPSKMGVLTEVGRLHPSAVRTGHPIYSFAVIGNASSKFKNVNNYSGYGSDSPFSLLRLMNGKIAVLDLQDQNSMTFYHHVEEMNEVDYRYHKEFSALYTDVFGITEKKTYSLFVRNLKKNVLTHVNPTGELLWEKGLYHGDRPNIGSGLRVIKANDMFDFVSNIITSGKAKNFLYRIKGE